MIDPATIKSAAGIAAGLLRIFSSLWADKPYPPYRYFQLGQLISRQIAAAALGVPGKESNPVWIWGVGHSVLNAYMLLKNKTERSPTQYNKLLLLAFEQKHYVSKYKSYLLAGKNAPHPRKLSDVPNEAGDPDDPYWAWIQLGLQEWWERFNPKVRAVVGMTLPEYMGPLLAADKAYLTVLTEKRLAEKKGRVTRDLIQREVAARIAAARIRGPMRDKIGQLAVLWRGTPARKVFKAGKAKTMLERIAGERLERYQKQAAGFEAAAADARWYGPPVPWAMEIAAKSYKAIGPAAVMRYMVVKPGDMTTTLGKISPEGVNDPLLRLLK